MAVYTDVTADDLTEFLAVTSSASCAPTRASPRAWRIPISCCTPSAGNFILTLYEKRVAADDLPFFLGLMEHLAARGITCPQPVKNKNGGVLGKLAGRPAAIVTFLDGLWIRRPNAGHCAAVGEALARLHLAGTDFPGKRANALSLRQLAAALRARRRARRQRAPRPVRRDCSRSSTCWKSPGRAICPTA